MFFEIGVLKNFAIFTGKHLCWLLQPFFYWTPTIATSGFLRQQILFSADSDIYCYSHTGLCSELLRNHELNVRSSHWNSYVKKVFIETLQVSQKKQPCWSLYLRELQNFTPAALLKRDSNTDVFLWNLQNS